MSLRHTPVFFLDPAVYGTRSRRSDHCAVIIPMQISKNLHLFARFGTGSQGARCELRSSLMRTSSPRAKIGLGDTIFSPDPAPHSRDHLQLDQFPPAVVQFRPVPETYTAKSKDAHFGHPGFRSAGGFPAEVSCMRSKTDM